MKKKLIYFNEQEYNRQKDVFLHNLKVLNEIADEYAILGIDKISPTRIKEIISGDFSNIQAVLLDAIEKEATNSLIRKVLKIAVLDGFEIFQTKIEVLVSKFKKTQCGVLQMIHTPLEYFSIKNGKFEITDDTWQKIKDERCSIYISTKQEQKIYNSLQKLAEASNEFMSSLGPNLRDTFFPLNSPFDLLIQTDNGFEPDPTTNYKYLTQ